MSGFGESEFATNHKRRVNLNALHPRPNHRPSPQEQEIEDANKELFEELSVDSGKLKINGASYKILDGNVYGCKENELEINQQNLVGKIENLNKLGKGSFGTVSQVKVGEILMANKEMYLNNQNISHLRELKVMQKCKKCPQIVGFYGYVIDKMKVSIYMESMDTSAAKILKLRLNATDLNTNNTHFNIGFPEQIISKLAFDVTNGLDYLKTEHRTMHRDLHPGNILLDRQGNIKLCDFGIAGKLNKNSLVETFTRGCLAYSAPERLKEGIEEKKEYGAPADVWSLGIVLVHLARGTNPYMTMHVETPVELIIYILNTDPPRLQQPEGFSLEFCKLVEKCLQMETNNRPKIGAILEDPFVKKAEQIDKFDVAQWVNEQLALSNNNSEIRHMN